MLELRDSTLHATPAPHSSTGVSVISPEELAGPKGGGVPPVPAFRSFGETRAYMTPRYVLSASDRVYRIFKFRSVQPRIEFPRTTEGWARAWHAFRELDAEASIVAS
jgi:hypothetical protein